MSRPARGLSDLPSARLLADAAEASHVAITISDLSDPEVPLVYVNRAFERMTGYPREEVIGRNCRFLQGSQTERSAVEALRAAIRERRTCDVELLNYRKDGTPFWNSLHLAPLHGEGREAVAIVGIQRDVTQERERRRAEREMEKMLALGRLAQGVAHEINNLLQPVLTLPELVAAALPPDADEARADLQIIRESARDARAIVRRLLDFGRPPDGSERVCRFDGALAEAVQAARSALPSGVTLTVEETDADRPVRMDKTEVKQILLNLAANAADAMEGAGAIAVTVRGRADGLLWRIEDDGPGIPAAIRERILEPFYGTKPVGRGTGLGLFIVHEIVRRAGGTIAVGDAEGGGAAFLIDLPLAAADAARGDAATAAGPQRAPACDEAAVW